MNSFKNVHFIFISKDGVTAPKFTFLEYVSIRSFMLNNNDYECHLYVTKEALPVGSYFDKIKSEYDINIHELDDMDMFMGNPIPYFTHKTDIIRLLVLLKYGGIYLDLDTITDAKINLDQYLTDNDLYAVEEDDNYRMATSMLMAKPKSKSVELLLNLYKDFRSKGRDEYFVEICQEIPYQLYNLGKIPGAVIVNSNEFVIPKTLMDHKGNAVYFDKFFENNSKIFEGVKIYHIWTELNKSKYIDTLDICSIGFNNMPETNFHNLIRKYIQ